jgi:hypothetical protein
VSENEVTEDMIYCAYLQAFAVTGSGGALPANIFGIDARLGAARALGVCAAKDPEGISLPWVKAHLLAEINEMMTAKAESEERPCKVVPMNGDDK